MELSILDKNFKRKKLIQNWNSLIWTERYETYGDFQLVTHRIAETMEMLPLGLGGQDPTLIAIDDSDVPMIVETHKIKKPKNGMPFLTVTGRSFETFLDQRTAIQYTFGLDRTDWSISADSPAKAAYAVMYDVVVSGGSNHSFAISQISLFNSVTDVTTTETYQVEPKELYTWVMETLKSKAYALKSTLPLSSSTDAKIAVTIYKGTDRRNSFAFDVSLDQFDEAEYLFSNLSYKNSIIVESENMLVGVFTNTESDLGQRATYIDLSKELAGGPPNPYYYQRLFGRGARELRTKTATGLFTGQIAESLASGYNKDYFLGDILKLKGDYGLSQDVRVAEFVRTQDPTGSKSYPTFEEYKPEEVYGL